MNNCESFLAKHGIPIGDDYSNYHYSYALYTSYIIEAMQQAEDLEDGLYFEEDEVARLLDNLYQAQKTMHYYREKLDVPYPEFDIAEPIALKGCRLEKGKIIGSEQDAVEIAGMWMSDFRNDKGSFFTYEVAVYILFLLQKEVDYGNFCRKE